METLTVYLPQDEFRLLYQQVSILRDGICYSYYYKKFEHFLSTHTLPQEDFYRFSSNAYYDEIILSWCKIFGSYNEPCHYKEILKYQSIKECLESIQHGLSNEELLSSFLLDYADKTGEYKKYHEETKKYRDMYLIHREHAITKVSDGDIIFPKVDIAERAHAI